MALTDPELDLLREMLVDAPDDDAFLEVGEELVRRLRWAEAEQVLLDAVGSLSDGDERRPRAMALLARASLETGRYEVTATALAALGPVGRAEVGIARVELLFLERSGRADEARARALEAVAADPNDVVAQSVLERLDLPPPSLALRARDPFYTVDRAERYVSIGRSDRAIRVYRRILANAADQEAQPLEQRLRQLEAAGRYDGADDLSEELTDPGLVPENPAPGEADVFPALASAEVPKIEVPAPNVGPVSINGGLEDYGDEVHTTEETMAADDEITDLQVARGVVPSASSVPTVVPSSNERERRKRRSLLRR